MFTVWRNRFLLFIQFQSDKNVSKNSITFLIICAKIHVGRGRGILGLWQIFWGLKNMYQRLASFAFFITFILRITI